MTTSFSSLTVDNKKVERHS